MRILHVAHAFPPESHGGTQQYVADLARLQVESGHQVGVVAGARTPAGATTVQHSNQDGVPVWWLLRRMPEEILSGDFGSVRIGVEIERLVAAFAPDLVHLHHWQNLTRDIAQRLAAARVPVVLTLHDLFVTCGRSFRMPNHRELCADTVTLDDCVRCILPDLPMPAQELTRLLADRAANFTRELAAASVVLAVSQAQADKLAAVGCQPRNLRALSIGIRRGSPLPPAAPVPGRLRLCSWAGLDPRKGFHVLLQALAGSSRREHFEVHVHGREGEPGYMQELARLGADLDVRYHGPFADGEHWSFATRYDLVVFPTLAFETHGLMVDEALQAGLPIVCSDLGAPPRRILGRGATFPVGDAGALRALLERLLDQPEEVARMRRAPHGAIDLETHHTAVLEVYAQVLSR